ncbi:glucosamine-6-phosphate deaminase [Planctomycetota bacterium]|nr:glucosamine-6-phosphate deaminase [Planctomycetota bacterium]
MVRKVPAFAMKTGPLSAKLVVRVMPSVVAASQVALEELQALLTTEPRALYSFATGATYQTMLLSLHRLVVDGRVSLATSYVTHLDEYLGFAPDQRGGMVHELCAACPSMLSLLRRGTFLPVPGVGSKTALAQHEARLLQLHLPRLQFLGIGRNGHIAFNEPGALHSQGFHVTKLAATTLQDAAARFAPAAVPTHAVTAGPASILSAKRLLMCAFGLGKAAAVRAMLEGPIGPECPAAWIRQHPDVLVLLDPLSASQLQNTVVVHG